MHNSFLKGVCIQAALQTRPLRQQSLSVVHRQRVRLGVEHPLVERQHRRVVAKEQIEILERLAQEEGLFGKKIFV